MINPEKIIQDLAQSDPGYADFLKTLPPEIAGITEPLPDGLMSDIVELIKSERPELSGWIESQPDAMPSRMSGGILPAIGVLSGIMFIFSSHIKFEFKNFYFEKKPMENEQLQKVLETFVNFINQKLKF